MSQEALKLRSEKWLRTYCEKEIDTPGYEEVMKAIACSGDYGEYIHFNDADAHGEIHPDFWYHYEVVTGIHFESPPTYFSCSC